MCVCVTGNRVFLWMSSVCVLPLALWCEAHISQLSCPTASGHHAWLALSMSLTDAPGTFHLYLSLFPSSRCSIPYRLPSLSSPFSSSDPSLVYFLWMILCVCLYVCVRERNVSGVNEPQPKRGNASSTTFRCEYMVMCAVFGCLVIVKCAWIFTNILLVLWNFRTCTTAKVWGQ